MTTKIIVADKVYRKDAVLDTSRPIEEVVENEEGEKVGWASGVVHHEKDRVQNWLEEEKISYEEPFQLPVAILKNMWVEEDYRDQGYGSELIEQFMSEAYDAATVLLYAEADDPEFDLVKWYRDFGFEPVVETPTGTLMVWRRT